MGLFDVDRRDDKDRYYTPRLIWQHLVRYLQIPPEITVVDPSCGNGGMLEEIAEQGHAGHRIAVDIDPDARGLQSSAVGCAVVGDWPEVAASWPARGDYLDDDTQPGVGLVLGNPPFAPAVEHIRAALRVSPVVAFILRSTFVEPVPHAKHPERSRLDLMRDHPPALEWTWPERIRFGGAAGSDSVLHSLIIWQRGKTSGVWQRELLRPDVVGWMPETSVDWLSG